ncbi:ATP-dependent helicase [Mariniluteicoccus endophyticus]
MDAMSDPMNGFGPATRAWFTGAYAEPTPAQAEAWRAIGSGGHALVVAPTGSGKTLAAFLSAIDRLAREPRGERRGPRVLYVSPLKALAVDVERNLTAPLRGIAVAAERLGEPVPEIRVGVRSGDTSAAERRRLVTRPPDIMITTPESLFLMMTSQARESLRDVDTVILDEIHVLAATKRGAHLALTLARLDRLVGRPVQRIGLSATVRPAERVAEFLHATEPVAVIAPPAAKQWDLRVVVPVEDMADPAATTAPVEGTPPDPRQRSIWPHVESEVLNIIESHRSTIVFANSRRLAERLTAHLNELHAERRGLLDESLTGARPTEMAAQSGTTRGVSATVARAHHGSVSKEQRARIEADLKSGDLPCVVATSSLELGIDMGAVDVVVQIAAPPSVASGLQRVGRAGHQVGAVSEGVFFPDHRGDLLDSALVVDLMREGRIEQVRELTNPLDVLAQQIVAICALDEIGVDELFALVRGAAHFTTLPRSAFEAVLDMLAGRYPSEDFAELRPRLVWDREAGVLRGRPGAQRLATTSGGTIPDRGLFGVFLAGDGDARRVGELDEEMVYESRVGDVFTLGTSSWRIEAITHDQVQVSPAPGTPGRLPFWRGDSPGRPAELGLALGTFLRELAADPEAARVRLASSGLDERAVENLLTYVDEQARATGQLPTDRTIVVERFRDEIGDWRVCVHSALGTPVLSAWALAIERQARDRGVQVNATATNDGIVIQVPDTDAAPPGAELVVIDPDELERLVIDEVGGSALFASRFRESAARALLLPRRDPRSRSPLWQQRMRASQLLAVAARYPDFPIVLETMRECLHDVFDLPALVGLQRRIATREVAVAEVETREASPFARSLLFGYVGEFVYEGDAPLAEKRAAALTLDPSLLAELLGSDALDLTLDAEVVAEVESELQSLAPTRRATTVEQVFDLVRTTGPLTRSEVTARCDGLDADGAVDALLAERRVFEVRIAGATQVASVDDLPRLHDGLGVPAPPGFGVVALGDGDPVGDLVLRWARTHGPFVPAALAERYGLGVGLVRATCQRMVDDATLVRGRYFGSEHDEAYCHHRVLALIKRRTLARLRSAVEPVDQSAYARFLPAWQGVGSGQTGLDGLLTAVDALAGVALPASMLESVILPVRVEGYTPALLDELLASGEVSWTGDGQIGSDDGWVRLWPGDWSAPIHRDLPESPAAHALWERLAEGGGWWFDDLVRADVGMEWSRSEWELGLWALVWAGRVRSDTFAPVRALAASGALKSHRPPRPRSRAGMVRASRRQVRTPTSQTTAGRWSATSPADRVAEAERLLVQLDRYGVLTRGSVLAEQPDASFSPAYRALSRLEESGQCLRGYFIDGLGAAQFAAAATVDRLRDQPSTGAVLLAATDPANAYGAALEWPQPRAGHRPGRKPGALVVQVDGRLACYVERGARTLLTFTEDDDELALALGELAAAVRRGVTTGITVEKVDGTHVFEHRAARAALEEAGFTMSPQGFRLRG